MRKGSCGHSCRAMLRDEIVMGGEARRGARDDRFDVADKARQLLAAKLIGHRVIAARPDILTRQHLEPAVFAEQLVALARTAERRVGKECVSMDSSRGTTYHLIHNETLYEHTFSPVHTESIM